MSTLDTPVPVACARTTERWLSPRALLVLSLAALYLIWRSTYLALRYVVEAAPPLLSAGTRYLAAGLILYVIGVATGAAKRGRGAGADTPGASTSRSRCAASATQ